MHRIIFSLFSFLAVFCCQAADQPNVIVFLVDDMGLMDTSVPFLTRDGKVNKEKLNSYYRTPAMEELARRGIRFSQFYANSVCSPSRASLMNGQSSARHKTTQFIKPEGKNTGKKGPAAWNWNGLTSKDVTLPRLLQNAGYRTIHCGKAHFAPIGKEGENPEVLGFDVNIAGCAFGLPGSYHGEHAYGLKKGNKRRAVPGLEKYHGKEIFLTEALTLEFNKELEKAVADKKPFFGYMSHYAVHGPFNSDPRFAANYSASGKAKSAQAFATLIEGMDKSLGDVMKKLDDLGVAENTLIIFLGDNGSDAPLGAVHGYSSSAPLRGKKGTHYEGGMRVPFITSWARPDADKAIQKKYPVGKGMNSDDFFSICDIFPTVLSLAGVDAPKNHRVDGYSLLSPLAGGRDVNPQKFLMHFPHDHRSDYFSVYREKKWKLIYHYFNAGNKRFELFDLEKDPYENNNLASSSPEVLQKMLQAMKRELKDADAQYPQGAGAPSL